MLAGQDAIDWALGNGLVMLSGKEDGTAVHLPVTLQPSPFARKAYEHALSVQTKYNELYVKISRDRQWLETHMARLAKLDPDFTGRLWNIYLQAQESSVRQTLSLGLFRSDYLMHSETGRLQDSTIRQVEFNTISVSFGAHSTKVTDLHDYLLRACPGTDKFQARDCTPKSESLDKLAAGLARAHRHYVAQQAIKDPEQALIVFLVQPNERNAIDQRLIEYALWYNHKITSIRSTLESVGSSFEKDSKGKLRLRSSPHHEIAVIYFRSGYSPAEYTSESHWQTRLFLETSWAIKCPSISTQLAGSKIIQQILTDPHELSHFEQDKAVQETLGSTFAAIYPMDESARGIIGRRLAFEDPKAYVLKPQREGGGNNIYGNDIPKFLNSIPQSTWPCYILMELIAPPPVTNSILRAGQLHTGEIVSELGVFGVVLWDESKLISNTCDDWLLRTKMKSSNEGGVAAGFGCVDAMRLVSA